MAVSTSARASSIIKFTSLRQIHGIYTTHHLQSTRGTLCPSRMRRFRHTINIEGPNLSCLFEDRDMVHTCSG